MKGVRGIRKLVERTLKLSEEDASRGDVNAKCSASEGCNETTATTATQQKVFPPYVQGNETLLSTNDLVDFVKGYETQYLTYELPFLINTIRRVR